MFRSGSFVAEQVTPTAEEQVQPNGVDLTVETILTQTTPGEITTTGKSVGDREPVAPTDGRYRLSTGAYVVQYTERLAVPAEHIGFVLPRSTLLRNSSTLHTAVWDAGYEGRGEGLLTVGSEIHIEPGARIGQFVLASADHAGVYSGSYQQERL